MGMAQIYARYVWLLHLLTQTADQSTDQQTTYDHHVAILQSDNQLAGIFSVCSCIADGFGVHG